MRSEGRRQPGPNQPRLFSYVVDHDIGWAPCASGRYCSLVICKYSKSARPNVVELAQAGDWVVGTGGAGKASAGHGRLVYAMRVTEKLALTRYARDPRFRNRADATISRRNPQESQRQALVSTLFWYFGCNAPLISDVEWVGLSHPLEKRGPGFRADFDPEFVANFAAWLRRNHPRPGIHGKPCAPVAIEPDAEGAVCDSGAGC